MDVSMVTEDTNDIANSESEKIIEVDGTEVGDTIEVDDTEVGNTIEIDDTEVGNTIELDDTEVGNTIELDDTEVGNTIKMNDTVGTNESTSNEGGYEMFENTITIEDTIKDITEREDSVTSGEESMSDSDQSQKYFAGCPIHNHHTDSQSMCPDDDPCSCLAEI